MKQYFISGIVTFYISHNNQYIVPFSRFEEIEHINKDYIRDLEDKIKSDSQESIIPIPGSNKVDSIQVAILNIINLSNL